MEISVQDLTQRIRIRYERVLEQVSGAAHGVGRDPETIRVVVVTKAQPVEIARAAIEAGVAILGENYPEEGVMKIRSLAAQSAVEWHMIGHVQSRKARMVAENFALLHSLDSLKLAKKLDRMAAEAGRELPVLLEVNVGGEASKFGWVARNRSEWPELYPPIEEILALSNLKVKGLMTMPPWETDPQDARVYFQSLGLLRDHLAVRYPQANWDELSMGTSTDFEVAVQEGATLVRVGTAIVGPRMMRNGD
jgi:pyridoxal phosphate enzyme (YggS family)